MGYSFTYTCLMWPIKIQGHLATRFGRALLTRWVNVPPAANEDFG